MLLFRIASKMNYITVTIVLSSMFLFACGGSDGDGATEALAGDSIAKLTNTSWEKACSPYNKFPSDDLTDLWNVKIKLRIDYSLKSTYKTQFFDPNDTECKEAMEFDRIDVSTLEITGKIISEESIAANGLNETFVYSSENGDLGVNYTLIYINSERLYFGQPSASNLGETAETRHSSISLDDYFTQVLN